jgi:hypothetical protein
MEAVTKIRYKDKGTPHHHHGRRHMCVLISCRRWQASHRGRVPSSMMGTMWSAEDSSIGQAWRVQRSVQDTSGTWRVRDVWSTTANGIIAELTEENERRLKLSFPVRLGRAWDSNVFNVNPELEVGYEEVDVAWSVNGLSFDSTALVQNTVPANPVDRRDLVERYAKGIGMVYKQWEETNTQMTGTRGFKVTMVAVDHGTN